jgi:hypothetical protein
MSIVPLCALNSDSVAGFLMGCGGCIFLGVMYSATLELWPSNPPWQYSFLAGTLYVFAFYALTYGSLAILGKSQSWLPMLYLFAMPPVIGIVVAQRTNPQT